MGMYHWGVVKCLHEQDLLPSVLCGSSIGALVVALLAITPDAELGAFLATASSINFEAFEVRRPACGGASLSRVSMGLLQDSFYSHDLFTLALAL